MCYSYVNKVHKKTSTVHKMQAQETAFNMVDSTTFLSTAVLGVFTGYAYKMTGIQKIIW